MSENIGLAYRSWGVGGGAEQEVRQDQVRLWTVQNASREGLISRRLRTARSSKWDSELIRSVVRPIPLRQASKPGQVE